MIGMAVLKRWTFLSNFIVIFLFLLFLSGCRSGGTLNDFEQSSLSKEGIRAEDFLPADTFVLLEFNRANIAQYEQFKKLLDYFPKSTDQDSVWNRLLKDANDYLVAFNLTYETNIQPLIDENTRMVLAGRFADNSLKETYLVLGLKDAPGYDSLLDQLGKNNQSGRLALVDYNGYKLLFDNNSNVFLTRIKDLAVAGIGLDQGKALVDRFNSKKDVLAVNKSYRQIVDELSVDRLGFFYIDVKSSLASAKATQAQAEIKNTSLAGKILGEGFVVMADSQGFKIDGYVLGDDKSDLNFRDYAGKRALYSVVPVSQLMGYFESYNLKQFFDTTIKNALAIDPNFQQTYTDWQTRIKTITQLDLEEDILSWMNQNYSLVVQPNPNSVIPAISLFVKASDSKKAKDFARIVGAQLRGVLPFIQSFSSQFEGTLSEDLVPIGSGEITKFTLDLAKLAVNAAKEEVVAVPEAMKNDKIVLQYGVAGDDVFVLSTSHDLAADYDRGGLNNDDQFAAADKKLDDYSDGLVFVKPGTVMDYVKFLMSFTAQVRGTPMTADDKKNMELIESYVRPVKSLILGSKLEEKDGRLRGYILINNQ